MGKADRIEARDHHRGGGGGGRPSKGSIKQVPRSLTTVEKKKKQWRHVGKFLCGTEFGITPQIPPRVHLIMTVS